MTGQEINAIHSAMNDFRRARQSNEGSIYFAPKSDDELIDNLATAPSYAKEAIRNALREQAIKQQVRQGGGSGGQMSMNASDPLDQYKDSLVAEFTKPYQPREIQGRMVVPAPMDPFQAISMLQKDDRFRQLDEDRQMKVLSSIGGAEAGNAYKLAKTQAITRARESEQFNNQGVRLLSGMLQRGDLQYDPEQGLLEKKKDELGRESFVPANPFIRNVARSGAWEMLGLPGDGLSRPERELITRARQQTGGAGIAGMSRDDTAYRQFQQTGSLTPLQQIPDRSMQSMPMQQPVVSGAVRQGIANSQNVEQLKSAALQARQDFVRHDIPAYEQAGNQTVNEIGAFLSNLPRVIGNAGANIGEFISGQPMGRFQTTTPSQVGESLAAGADIRFAAKRAAEMRAAGQAPWLLEALQNQESLAPQNPAPIYNRSPESESFWNQYR